MEQRFYDMVEANPVIAAIKDTEGLEQCCRVPDIKVVFILYGDICNISDIVGTIKKAGYTGGCRRAGQRARTV